MKELSKPTVQTVSKRYHDSLLFNTELGLYDTVQEVQKEIRMIYHPRIKPYRLTPIITTASPTNTE